VGGADRGGGRCPGAGLGAGGAAAVPPGAFCGTTVVPGGGGSGWV